MTVLISCFLSNSEGNLAGSNWEFDICQRIDQKSENYQENNLVKENCLLLTSHLGLHQYLVDFCRVLSVLRILLISVSTFALTFILYWQEEFMQDFHYAELGIS